MRGPEELETERLFDYGSLAPIEAGIMAIVIGRVWSVRPSSPFVIATPSMFVGCQNAYWLKSGQFTCNTISKCSLEALHP